MGEAKRRKALNLMPTKKPKRKRYASCRGQFQTRGQIIIPGVR